MSALYLYGVEIMSEIIEMTFDELKKRMEESEEDFLYIVEIEIGETNDGK